VTQEFRLFGPEHLAILAAIAGASAGLALLARRSPTAARRIRLGLGVFLLVNESVWWAYRLRTEGLAFPEGLPLQLSDLVIWLTIFTLFTGSQWAFAVAYYAGLTTAVMAVLTPDLWTPLASYPSVYFFLEHGGVVVAVVTLIGGRIARPEPGSIWVALLAVNLWAAVAGAFNIAFGTNYMYLSRKPAAASLLDYFGPWPVYIIVAEAFAIIAFWLLWLPFKRQPSSLR
jgi:hypothetical integral membrane protein (TIGR02206 family)